MIPLPNVADQTFLVLGFGKSGQASAAALKASGAQVFVCDDREMSREKAIAGGYALAPLEEIKWQNVAGLVVSPGVPLKSPHPHPLILKAQETLTPILSDLDLLFKACPKACYVGITGTNGKSTTTALIGHILKQAGKKVQTGGNIGTAALSLDPLEEDGFYVLELSSYQLDLIRTNPLRVAVLLNITPDHFARHGGLEGYIEAKMKITRTEDAQTLILGTDEPETQEVFERLKDRKNLVLETISSRHDPQRGIRLKNGHLLFSDDPKPLDLSSFKNLPGAHNAQNAAAAFLACRALVLDRQTIEMGLASFPGLAHRQQAIAEIKGVRFINDSKATNADAAAKALTCYENIYWIAGGQPKEGGLAGLESYRPHIAHTFLIGEATEAFALWCEGKGFPFTRCDTLESATRQAAAMAAADKRKDPVVLLSPACASWDQFASFEERGERFVELVKRLERKA